jgi:hypothetical protein
VPERVQEAFRVAKLPSYLDTPLSEDEAATVADLITDTATGLTAEEAAETVIVHPLDDALNAHLSSWAAVLHLRFGLVADTPRTLERRSSNAPDHNMLGLQVTPGPTPCGLADYLTDVLDKVAGEPALSRERVR